MKKPSTRCVKCSEQMEFGLLVDRNWTPSLLAGHWTPPQEKVLDWVRGTPKRGWWEMEFKTKPEDRLQVATLRCTACGYLELYAPQAE